MNYIDTYIHTYLPTYVHACMHYITWQYCRTRFTKGHGIKRAEGPNSLISGTRSKAIARGEGPNIELRPSGTNSLLLKYEEPVECLLYLEAALLGTS